MSPQGHRLACIDELVGAIAAVRRRHPTRVAIDGVDGAGKTTLADELVGPLARTGRQVIRASIDGFHLPREVRYRRGKDSPEGYFLDSFDYTGLKRELLRPLGPGGTRLYRLALFDHRHDRAVDGSRMRAADDAILLMDGVFLQRSELTHSWDLRLWLDVHFDLTVPRAVARDAAGTDQSELIRAKYLERYVPGQRLYLDQCRPSEAADIIVDNNDPQNPSLRYRPVMAERLQSN